MENNSVRFHKYLIIILSGCVKLLNIQNHTLKNCDSNLKPYYYNWVRERMNMSGWNLRLLPAPSYCPQYRPPLYPQENADGE